MTAICKRCDKPFDPLWMDGQTPRLCCGACAFRNMLDGLGLPTPPALIDKFTKHPLLLDPGKIPSFSRRRARRRRRQKCPPGE